MSESWIPWTRGDETPSDNKIETSLPALSFRANTVPGLTIQDLSTLNAAAASIADFAVLTSPNAHLTTDSFNRLEALDWQIPHSIRRVSYENPWELILDLGAVVALARLGAPALKSAAESVSILLQVRSQNAERLASARLSLAQALKIEQETKWARMNNSGMTPTAVYESQADDDRTLSASEQGSKPSVRRSASTGRYVPSKKSSPAALRREVDRLEQVVADEVYEPIVGALEDTAPRGVGSRRWYNLSARVAAAVAAFKGYSQPGTLDVSLDDATG